MLLCLFFISSFLLLVLFRILRHRGIPMVEVMYTEYRDLKNGQYNEWFDFKKLTSSLHWYINRTLCNTSVSYLYFSGALAVFRKAIITFMSVCPSVRPSALNNLSPTGRILMKFDIWVFFENLFRKFKFHWNLTGITGIWHETSIKIYDNISLNSYLSEKCLRRKL